MQCLILDWGGGGGVGGWLVGVFLAPPLSLVAILSACQPHRSGCGCQSVRAFGHCPHLGLGCDSPQRNGFVFVHFLAKTVFDISMVKFGSWLIEICIPVNPSVFLHFSKTIVTKKIWWWRCKGHGHLVFLLIQTEAGHCLCGHQPWRPTDTTVITLESITTVLSLLSLWGGGKQGCGRALQHIFPCTVICRVHNKPERKGVLAPVCCSVPHPQNTIASCVVLLLLFLYNFMDGEQVSNFLSTCNNCDLV